MNPQTFFYLLPLPTLNPGYTTAFFKLQLRLTAHEFEFERTGPQIQISELLDLVEVENLKKWQQISKKDKTC